MKPCTSIRLLLICLAVTAGIFSAIPIERAAAGEDLTAAITVMANGYEVNVVVNGIDIGVVGGKSESKRLFGKNHSMVSQLPENMKNLACLQPGANELTIVYSRIEEEDSTGLTIEIKSEEQFTNNEHVYFFREEPDSTNGKKTINGSFTL